MAGGGGAEVVPWSQAKIFQVFKIWKIWHEPQS